MIFGNRLGIKPSLILSLVLGAVYLAAGKPYLGADSQSFAAQRGSDLHAIDDEQAPHGQPLVELERFSLKTANGVQDRVNFSPDGKWLMVCDYRSVHFWDLTGPEPREASSFKESELHLRDILAAAISPDGTKVALGGYDKGVHLYALKDMRLTELSNEMEHDGAVRALQFSPDGKMLASGGDDVSVFLWDVKPDKLQERTMFKIENSIFGVQCLGFTPDSKSFYVNTGTGDVRRVVIGAGEPQQKQAFNEPATLRIPMAVSTDGKQLAFGSRKDVVLWKGTNQGTFHAHTNQVNWVEFNQDAKLIGSCGEDGRLILWDPTGHIRFSMQRPNPFDAVAFKPAKPGAADFWIAAANRNGTVYLLHLQGSAPPVPQNSKRA
jgi:WD40 repeat protein